MSTFLRWIAQDEAGATAVEYGLILSLMFLAIVGTLSSTGSNTTSMWNDVGNKMAESNAD
ncbi:Flp family type IVb pilin [Altererythrobacter sp. FM1]|uniref:Flp family type IVb pilin n=1 Tax=Tsuneonella flava TaxID=2055955 RepID=UPI000C7FD366|nr:Flp family type IVb pilin [Tsuneonella flava]ROT95542.1 Flp family type IVb pilin [Altererythrobacter sp. FM1]UBS31983.1 Flp family type IVb pilin [Altererythrobacter sp. N1]